jgi:D-alanyl-lipoteichoic acid acyltransferase DltB (MBOAT superfamily)
MSFISIAFIVFFAVITFAYYILPPKFRWILLLLVSCYFYMAFVPKYILILFALILIDFIFAQKIETTVGKLKHAYFMGSLSANLGILFVFKYFNFFNENLSTLANFLHWNYSFNMLHLILPLGLSFHIFQSLSYVIEVYRGKYPAERHLGIYALYVLFFPQLIAGPIERPAHLLPQFRKVVVLDWINIFSGLRLMAWGFFKKIVIADRLALSVDYVYSHIAHVPSLSILLSTIFFAIELYADFSGYSDIARGGARVLGIDLMRNFNLPYFSGSIAEFWRRWHISLSSWFRDYLYYPLTYSITRLTRPWLYASIVITFLLTGLWHGAGWTFIIMGALHGTYITLGLATKSYREKFSLLIGLTPLSQVRRIFQVTYTFALVCFSWIFFRSPNLETAVAFVKGLFNNWHLTPGQFLQQYYFFPYETLGISRTELLLSVSSIIFLLAIEYALLKKPLLELLNRQPIVVRSALSSGLILASIIFGVCTTKQFIYCQF